MAAIVTITFNPALDKSTVIDHLVPAKKLKCSAPVCEPGGGGINVARAIIKLGGEATAAYLAGGQNGELITRMLVNEGLECLVTPTLNTTRDNLVVLDSSTNQQYLLDMPGATVDETEWQACLNSLEAVNNVRFIVASGSLPPGVPPSVFLDLSNLARKKNAKLIVDTAGDGLTQAINAGVYLIKPNLRELALLSGKPVLTEQNAVEAAQQVLNDSNCEIIVVSLGELGALLVTRAYFLKIVPPSVAVKSTVGAGDSLVAGMVLSLSNHNNITKAVMYGVACGTAATMNNGTELCRKTDAEYLYHILQNETTAELNNY